MPFVHGGTRGLLINRTLEAWTRRHNHSCKSAFEEFIKHRVGIGHSDLADPILLVTPEVGVGDVHLEAALVACRGYEWDNEAY